MKALILALAFLVGGCCSWEPLEREGKEVPGYWFSTRWSDRCNMHRAVVIDRIPDHPEKYLYVVHEHTKHSEPCLIILRTAFASDTGRTYRWDELPKAFSPCD